MAEYTANALQTVAVNQNVLLTDEPIPGSRSIVHRSGSGLVTLRGLVSCNCCQTRARFKVSFGGNIAVPTGQTVGPISLAIAINGESVQTTLMEVTPVDVEEFWNVYSSVYIDVPAGCCSQISVKNTSDIPILVRNANVVIDRIA